MLDDEFGYSKYDYENKYPNNSRNGHSGKTLRTSFGDVEVSVPRGRKGEFGPVYIDLLEGADLIFLFNDESALV